MHLADGVLSFPTLIGASIGTAAGLAVGIRRLTPETLPSTALFTAVFFIVGTIHITIGIGSVHLIINGLIGLLLGWLAFPVIFVALTLQALLFSFGGFAVLGANTLLLATPAVLAHLALRPFVQIALPSSVRLSWLGIAAAMIGIGGSTVIASSMLWSTGREALSRLIVIFSAAQLPVLVIDAAVTALVVTALGRSLPSIFNR